MLTPLLFLSLYLHPPALATWPETPPPLSDLSRFPSAEMCERQLAFLAARRAYLDGLRTLYAEARYAPWFEDAVADVEDRERPWTVLYEAHGWAATPERMDEEDERRNYPLEPRYKMARKKLAELRSILGCREYSAGRLPALVGVEYWRRAD